jgi:hypothetical protein
LSAEANNAQDNGGEDLDPSKVTKAVEPDGCKRQAVWIFGL